MLRLYLLLQHGQILYFSIYSPSQLRHLSKRYTTHSVPECSWPQAHLSICWKHSSECFCNLDAQDVGWMADGRDIPSGLWDSHWHVMHRKLCFSSSWTTGQQWMHTLLHITLVPEGHKHLSANISSTRIPTKCVFLGWMVQLLWWLYGEMSCSLCWSNKYEYNVFLDVLKIERFQACFTVMLRLILFYPLWEVWWDLSVHSRKFRNLKWIFFVKKWFLAIFSSLKNLKAELHGGHTLTKVVFRMVDPKMCGVLDYL